MLGEAGQLHLCKIGLLLLLQDDSMRENVLGPHSHAAFIYTAPLRRALLALALKAEK